MVACPSLRSWSCTPLHGPHSTWIWWPKLFDFFHKTIDGKASHNQYITEIFLPNPYPFCILPFRTHDRQVYFDQTIEEYWRQKCNQNKDECQGKTAKLIKWMDSWPASWHMLSGSLLLLILHLHGYLWHVSHWKRWIDKQINMFVRNDMRFPVQV